MGSLDPKKARTRELLGQFAAEHDALDYSEWQDAGLATWDNRTFQEYFTEATKNAGRIHFNLTGLDMGTVAEGTADGFRQTGHVTAAELKTIVGNDELLGKTTFYRDGKVVEHQQVLNELADP